MRTSCVPRRAPIVADEWSEGLSRKHRGLKVLITHGEKDDTLPVVASEWTAALLGVCA